MRLITNRLQANRADLPLGERGRNRRGGFSLFWKLFAVQLLAAAVLIGGVLAVTRHQTAHSFAAYVEARERQRLEDVAERIAEQYVRHPDLVAAALSVREFRRRADPRRPGEPESGRGHGEHPLRPPLSLLDAEGQWIGGVPLPAGQSLRVPIRSGETSVGYLVRPPLPAWVAPEEAGFTKRQRATLLRVAAVSLPVAAVFALLISALLLAPIRRLSAGAAALGRREFDTRIAVDRSDELGRLAADFNRLAEALARYDSQQRQWLADVAHELRTPVAVLRGELEAMLDGLRTADPARLQSLQQEVLRLGALIDDLHLLSLAESGGLRLVRRRVDAADLLRVAQRRFAGRFAQAGFALKLALPDAPLLALLDVQRIEQLLGNLFENVLRHAQAPGPVRATAGREGGMLVLSVCDAGPGVPAEALSRLFDRLYRVEADRGRDAGGAGLGLSICRTIVEAHGGRIEARAAPAGGLCIRCTLPLDDGGSR